MLDYVGAKDDGDGGDNWSYKTCTAPVKTQQQHTDTKLFDVSVSLQNLERLHRWKVSGRCYRNTISMSSQFKLCLMMYKAMHGLAPAYLSELCASSCIEGRTRSSALAVTL